MLSLLKHMPVSEIFESVFNRRRRILAISKSFMTFESILSARTVFDVRILTIRRKESLERKFY